MERTLEERSSSLTKELRLRLGREGKEGGRPIHVVHAKTTYMYVYVRIMYTHVHTHVRVLLSIAAAQKRKKEMVHAA